MSSLEMPVKIAADRAYLNAFTVYRWCQQGHLGPKFVDPGKGNARAEMNAEDFGALLVIKYCIRFGSSMSRAGHVAHQYRVNRERPGAFLALSTHEQAKITIYVPNDEVHLHEGDLSIKYNGPDIDLTIPLANITAAAETELAEAVG